MHPVICELACICNGATGFHIITLLMAWKPVSFLPHTWGSDGVDVGPPGVSCLLLGSEIGLVSALYSHPTFLTRYLGDLCPFRVQNSDGEFTDLFLVTPAVWSSFSPAAHKMAAGDEFNQAAWTKQPTRKQEQEPRDFPKTNKGFERNNNI